MSNQINNIDASVPGVLSIGDNMRIWSLGSNIFIIVTSRDLSEHLQELHQTFDGVFPGTAIWVHANTDNLGTFTPLDQSPDLKALISKMVQESINEAE